jgi:hypothetical protein
MKVANLLVATTMVAAGCGGGEDESTKTQDITGPVQHFSDAAHTPGTAGFYIYPNVADVVPTVTPNTFNAAFKTRTKVEVNQVDCTTFNFMQTVGTAQNPVVYTDTVANPVAGQYRINTTATALGMTLGNCYRIVFKLDNAQLGYRDAKVLLNSQPAPADVKRIGNGQSISLVWRLEGSLDSDNDGVLNHVDNCPTVANPTQADGNANGIGDACDQPDTDNDGFYDAQDNCPTVANPAQEDGDVDGRGDACDACPTDPAKTISAGACGCGAAETDSDADGTPDCVDNCPSDSTKINGGVCGCGTPDTDSDGDGTADCLDQCPANPSKITPGACGCATSDVDTDTDGLPDCVDGCPADATKATPGQCGCGVPDTDTDGDGTANCHETCTP